jgi:hypothetical protein
MITVNNCQEFETNGPLKKSRNYIWLFQAKNLIPKKKKFMVIEVSSCLLFKMLQDFIYL